jgi:hypothetical protein
MLRFEQVQLLKWGFNMKSINILLYRNCNQQDWSVEIDGTRHNHVSTSTLDDLIEYAFVAAQQDLLAPDEPAGISAHSTYMLQ